MPRRPTPPVPRQAGVLLIDDSHHSRPALVAALKARGFTPVQASHPEAAKLTDADLARFGLVFIDACDFASQQLDPTASRLASLDLLERFAALPDLPRLIVHSTEMDRPSINIPVRELDVADGYYLADLASHVDSILGDPVPGHQAPAPTDADYRQLGVSREARVAHAHQQLRRRVSRKGESDAWNLVWNPVSLVPSEATRTYLQRTLMKEWLKLDGRYMKGIRVIQKVAGLPRER